MRNKEINKDQYDSQKDAMEKITNIRINEENI